MKNEEVFYVQIQNPTEFRRSLLEASRDMLRGLQKYEDLKKIRAKKEKEISHLKSVIKEINNLVNQAKNSLPSVSVKVAEQAKPKKEKKTKKGKKKASKKKSGKAGKKETEAEPKKEGKPKEVKELESQLKEIEGKLASLR